MHGATVAPAGSSRPPISAARVSRRATIGDHRPQAQRLLARPRRGTRRRRAHGARRPRSGWRSRRSNAHASAVAVVSCPATSSVMQLVAQLGVREAAGRPRRGRAAASRGCRRARRGRAPARRSAMSAVAAPRRPARAAPEQRRSIEAGSDRARRRAPSRRTRVHAGRARSSSSARRCSIASAPASTPKTARMMTSSVIACVCGRSASGSPGRPASRPRARSPRRMISR